MSGDLSADVFQRVRGNLREEAVHRRLAALLSRKLQIRGVDLGHESDELKIAIEWMHGVLAVMSDDTGQISRSVLEKATTINTLS